MFFDLTSIFLSIFSSFFSINFIWSSVFVFSEGLAGAGRDELKSGFLLLTRDGDD